MTACSPAQLGCGQFATCNVRDPLWKIRERILTALSTCSVSEMAEEGNARPAAAAAVGGAVAAEPSPSV
jgi:hypothetical protein